MKLSSAGCKVLIQQPQCRLLRKTQHKHYLAAKWLADKNLLEMSPACLLVFYEGVELLLSKDGAFQEFVNIKHAGQQPIRQLQGEASLDTKKRFLGHEEGFKLPQSV